MRKSWFAVMLNQKSDHWDAIIVGGGLAGGAAACHLARAGRRVLLLEKKQRAHHKVCGEFLSIEGQNDLLALGVDPLRFGAARINFIRLFNGRYSARARLPFQALGLSRFILDEQLLARATACGATVRRGCKVTEVERNGTRWRVDTMAFGSVEAHAVFLATGKHELRHQKRPAGRQNNLVGFKTHFRLPPSLRQTLAGHVDIALFDGGYAGLQLIEHDRVNLCLLIEQRKLTESGKHWGAVLRHIARSSPRLREFLNDATPCWKRPLAIASLPYGYVYSGDDEVTPGLYRLGDQFAVTPSFSGDGMSIALHTGKLAARAFLGTDEHASRFHSRARGDVRPQINGALQLANTMNSPVARPLGFLACRMFPSLITRMVKRTRLRSSTTIARQPEDAAPT